MHCRWFGCLLLAGLAYAQAAPAQPPTAGAATARGATASEKAPEKTVALDEIVLTVKGVCNDTSKQGDDCRTTVTRAQFDQLADSLQPNMPPAMRRQLANQYSLLLFMSSAAEKRGLDKGPAFNEKMRLARMSLLSQELRRALQEDAARLTDADLEEYYRKNTSNFEQADLLRLMIPHKKQIVNAKPDAKAADLEAQQEAGEAEMAKVAADLRARAGRGEDFDKLQKEAFEAAGFKGNPPDPKMNKVRRTGLPPKHGAAFDLKAGEVSELISDPSYYYIYKMVSKETMPLEAAKAEIRNTLSAQRFRDSMQAFQKPDNAVFNETYFGPAPRASAPPASTEASPQK